MEAAIDANLPLNYIEFHIFPSQNRYEARVCYENKKEKVTSGLLEHLLLHSTDIRSLHSRGSSAKYELSPPESSHDIKWFNKSTLIRFLHIIGSANILEVTNSLKNEISQLEEARRFHISLYTKGTKSHRSGESDGSHSNRVGSATEAEDSDGSKVELLRAMDLRLNALGGELTVAFDQAAGSRYSVEEMTDIEKFSRHFGSGDLSDALQKHIELSQGTKAPAVENLSCNQFSDCDGGGSKEINHVNESSSSETQVRYGVSPAKVAQVERQSSSGSDESSFSSEEEQQPERSRTLVRSASPRRSASPMRRIQIGRAGSRRSTAITIKSLNCIPARERSFLPKDTAGSDSEEEGSQQAPKKSENNVRISVQDAINIFESKQRDQTMDIQKARSLLNASIGANKSVLRRWSSGMGEDSSRHPQDTFSEVAVTKIRDNIENRKVTHSSPESEAKPDVILEDCLAEPCGSDAKFNSTEKGSCSSAVTKEETLPTESTDVSEKLTASAEWSHQKEAELNEMLKKMMETKPVKTQNVVRASSKRQSLPSEQRGGFYDHYKEKRDEKLRGEGARKRAQKEKHFRAMEQIRGAKKSQLDSANASDAGRKHNVKKMQKPQKSVAEPANPKNESAKPGIVKKASSKAASLPATRKSWPSVPSPRASGPSPAKTPPTSTGVMPTRRRSQPTPSVSLSNLKVETSQMRAKSVKSKQNDVRKTLGSADKKQETVTKPRKTAKSKVQTAPEDLASAEKPSLYSKVTKKSSVVPLESKPFLRKGSGTISNVNPAAKKKVSSLPQEPLRKSEDLTLDEENVTVSNPSDVAIQHEEREIGEMLSVMECGTTVGRPQNREDNEGFGQLDPATDEGIDKVVEPELKPEDKEETISPTAWVEIEEHEYQTVTSEGHICEIGGSSPTHTAPVGGSSSRVRHSLSQMLLEESSEPDVIDWGNAENPPQVVYHRDAPKGLKRLLKFARKSKTEANAGGWSSPSVFSEGEDDAEDSKLRGAENLLKKATLHSKRNGLQKHSTDNEHPAQANISKFNTRSLSQQFQKDHVSASVPTTKATRSFLFLSAFKSSK